MKYSNTYGNSFASKAAMEVIKSGASSTLQGVYSKTGTTTFTERATVQQISLIASTAAVASGALSTVAQVGAAIALLAIQF